MIRCISATVSEDAEILASASADSILRPQDFVNDHVISSSKAKPTALEHEIFSVTIQQGNNMGHTAISSSNIHQRAKTVCTLENTQNNMWP